MAKSLSFSIDSLVNKGPHSGTGAENSPGNRALSPQSQISQISQIESSGEESDGPQMDRRTPGTDEIPTAGAQFDWQSWLAAAASADSNKLQLLSSYSALLAPGFSSAFPACMIPPQFIKPNPNGADENHQVSSAGDAAGAEGPPGLLLSANQAALFSGAGASWSPGNLLDIYRHIGFAQPPFFGGKKVYSLFFTFVGLFRPF